MRITITDMSKQIEKEREFKTQISKYVQEQTNKVQGIKKLAQEMLKMAISL